MLPESQLFSKLIKGDSHSKHDLQIQLILRLFLNFHLVIHRDLYSYYKCYILNVHLLIRQELYIEHEKSIITYQAIYIPIYIVNTWIL